MNLPFRNFASSPQEKYFIAKKDILDVVNAFHKAQVSVNDLTPQQRDCLFRELAFFGMDVQSVKNWRQNYERQW